MISKNKIKYLHSLEQKKNRDTLGVFVAEGPKVVGDIITSHPSSLRMLVATAAWLQEHTNSIDTSHCETMTVSDEELAKVSFLCHPQQVLGVFEKFVCTPPSVASEDTLILMLDGVQDPGNLGTIVRIADWFGIDHIVCSPDTVDIYNPKVVQATMGSLARVNIFYTQLDGFLNTLPNGTPIYGTLLEGYNMYNADITSGGVIVMGNEGKGISPALRRRVTNALRIPNYPAHRKTADSLNVAIATAIVCAEFRRHMI